ncbi:MAG: phage protein Gp27 family protein [Eisenbergiella porci]|uniref:phage protein Gp27 family protein n=1 Tax=Eisenbergiella porci TaxID=2652274 RepID=UPI002A75C7D7|nr:phage protein Gp27 family protein [Eisenbergiella porci]MDY2654987.1 phage protein Gp27 family protein [Eisenbergiella porci]
MGKQRNKKRITSKIDELPEQLRLQVDLMLADTSNTYVEISQFLKTAGYEISKSSICRYAARTNTAMQRLKEAQLQTDKLVQVIKENPDADYTEAAIVLTMNGLVNRMATAEEEFDAMPLDKAGRLIASLSRTKVYKDRVRQDMKDKADIAFKEMETEMMKVIKQDPVAAEQLKAILQRAKERMVQYD